MDYYYLKTSNNFCIEAGNQPASWIEKINLKRTLGKASKTSAYLPPAN
jgi:hypothetical protein